MAEKSQTRSPRAKRATTTTTSSPAGLAATPATAAPATTPAAAAPAVTATGASAPSAPAKARKVSAPGKATTKAPAAKVAAPKGAAARTATKPAPPGEAAGDQGKAAKAVVKASAGKAAVRKAGETKPATKASAAVAPKAAAPKAPAPKAPALSRLLIAGGEGAPAPDEVAAKRAARAAIGRSPKGVATGSTDKGLAVLIVASEAAPIAGQGGLADGVGRLATALGAAGNRVTVVVPKYAGTGQAAAPVDRFTLSYGGRDEEATCYEVPLGEGARAILVEHPAFFDREHLYGQGTEDYPDNPRRFAFLSRAALEFAAREGESVDVVHAHDWQAGLVPVLLRTAYAGSPVLGGAGSVFTVHNAAFQGLCGPEWLEALGLSRDLFSLHGLEYWGRVSFLKGGVNFADLVSAATTDLAEALTRPGEGSGLEGVVAARGEAFRGAVSGTGAGLAKALRGLYGAAIAARRG